MVLQFVGCVIGDKCESALCCGPGDVVGHWKINPVCYCWAERGENVIRLCGNVNTGQSVTNTVM